MASAVVRDGQLWRSCDVLSSSSLQTLANVRLGHIVLCHSTTGRSHHSPSHGWLHRISPDGLLIWAAFALAFIKSSLEHARNIVENTAYAGSQARSEWLNAEFASTISRNVSGVAGDSGKRNNECRFARKTLITWFQDQRGFHIHEVIRTF